MIETAWPNLWAAFLFYSFLGWLGEAVYYAVARQKFYNRGILSLPLTLSYGVIAVILIPLLPTLGGNHVLGYLATLVVVAVVEALDSQVTRHLSRRLEWGAQRDRLLSGSWRGLVNSALLAAVCYCVYLLIHPFFLGSLALTPALAVQIAVAVALALVAADFLVVVIVLRRGKGDGYRQLQEQGRRGRLFQKISALIWKRLQKAYPGIQEMEPEARDAYVFAKGVCFDKLVWVFLVSALLGDLIETLFCGLVDGAWMSRSSVLYGPFSFVWGLGAVVLTVSLQGLAQKADRYVFLAGAVIGGVYEYLCSVFTELAFGTVFWDYSDMPLNIGGRTNLLFCFFWGVLAVVWLKLLYPPMSRAIEKLPAVAGKAATWAVLLFMVCNAVLTCAAMLRYESRQTRPDSANVFEEFIDRAYDDDYMEARWPNMIRAVPSEDGEEGADRLRPSPRQNAPARRPA